MRSTYRLNPLRIHTVPGRVATVAGGPHPAELNASRPKMGMPASGPMRFAPSCPGIQLTALENPSSSEVEAIELLTLLVERYEQAHYPIPASDAVSVVRFLIERQGLTQRELTSEFGSGPFRCFSQDRGSSR